MRACALVAPGRFELVDLPSPPLGPHDVRVRPGAVGVCGTDLHIYGGDSNYHFDDRGRAIPLQVAPQVLGHEIAGAVLECGAAVRGLSPGDRVVVDQGRNCRSEARATLCEYCATGDSHQCEHYREHGITGLPGGFADELVVPAVNTIAVRTELPLPVAAMTEPCACVLHCLDRMERTPRRYGFGGGPAPDRVRTAVVLGGGPAGLLFVQLLRHRLAFDGPLLLSDPSPHKRALAEALGATAVAPDALAEAVRSASRGRMAEFVVEASGHAAAFAALGPLIRKQATVLLYGLGHGGGDLSLLGHLQWREAVLVTSVGASGGFDADGRPAVYRAALQLLEAGTLRVQSMLTHEYRGLAAVPQAFAGDHRDPGYLKGVAVLS